MKSLLICPSERPSVRLLSETMPLATVPMLGESLLEYWLSWSALSGVKQVLISAHDRPDEVRSVVGDGARWGLAVKVIAESRELTPAEALLKYGTELGQGLPRNAIALLDHFPPLSQPAAPNATAGKEASLPGSLFSSYADWFAAMLAWAPRALTPDRVGVHELRPGVWVGLHCRISRGAKLQAPCWLGKNVRVGAGATIGPEAIVEDGAVIETAATIQQSYVGQETLVGEFTQIAHSVAWGERLIDTRAGSVARVADPFVLCSLRRPARQRAPDWLGRLSDLYLRNKEEAHELWKQLVMNKEG